jgi:hypothetical protein
MTFCKLVHPMSPHRAFTVEVEMGQPRRHPDDRRPAATHGVGEPHANRSCTEANLLLHLAERYLAPVDSRQPRRNQRQVTAGPTPRLRERAEPPIDRPHELSKSSAEVSIHGCKH